MPDQEVSWHEWDEIQQKAATLRRQIERDLDSIQGSNLLHTMMRHGLQICLNIMRWVEEQARRGKYGDAE